MSEAENKIINIIVVDDEDIVTSLVSDALEDEGHEVDTASSAADALRIIGEKDIHLIITDIRMPHMDGIEMVKQARALRPGVVVIFMTGYANLNSAKEAIKQGAFEYILKPFELMEIRQAVTNAVDKIRSAELEDATEQLDRLSDLSAKLYTAGDRKSLATLSLKFAMMHCASSCGAVIYWESGRTNCGLIRLLNDQTEEIPIDDAQLAGCLEKIDLDTFGKPFSVESYQEHPLCRVADAELKDIIFTSCEKLMHRLVTVPIRRSNHLYGMIIIGFEDEASLVKDSDLKLLSITSSQLALSLENISLLKEAQEAYATLKELQDETIQLEKMATKGEMSAEIGHELNNFLGVVAGNLQLLEFHMKKETYEQLPRYVHAIAENVDKIKKFTANLMDLAAISSQKEILHFDKLLAEVVDYLKPQKRYRGVEISLSIDAEDIPFQADQTHIQQVLYNLFNNAADATEGCGTRRIAAAVGVDRSDGTFGVTIRDTGVGIEKDLLAKAFNQKFTTKKNGHGFGLLVCKRIIDSHGGKLSVESALGQGTSIRIDFPLAVEQETAPVPA